MTSKRVVALHEAALEEARAAYDWYAARNPAAAEAFVDELDHAIKQIEKFLRRLDRSMFREHDAM